MKASLRNFIFILLLSSLGLGTGCTIHRSEGRNQFEAAVPDKVFNAEAQLSGFKLKSCKTESLLETWLNQEFPNRSYELILSESDLEIWQSQNKKESRNQDLIEIKALQREGSSTQSCVYEFANDLVWNLYKDQFIRELRNNIMMVE